MIDTPRQTLRALASYTPTRIASAVSAMSAIALAHHHGWTAAAIAVGLAVCALSLGIWVVMAMRSNGYAHHLRKRHEMRTTAHQEQVATLRDTLIATAGVKSAEQLDLIERKMATLRAVLLERLDAGELTFHRYLHTAEQVYLSGLDNLNEIKVAATARQAIDTSYLARSAQDAKTDTERAAIAERAGHAKSLDEKIDTLTAQNEQIMSALDATTTAMAHTQMNAGGATLDADSAMAELGRLAERTARYAAAR